MVSMKRLQTDVEAIKQKQSSTARTRQDGRNKATSLTCYKCKKEGHIRKNCPLLESQGASNACDEIQPKQGRGSNRNVKPRGSIGVSQVNDASLYLERHVHGLATKCLVDTGSTISIVSKSFLERNKTSLLKQIVQTDQNFVSASGESLKIMGKCEVTFKIGQFEFIQTCIVADIVTDCIIGLDFLKNHNSCVLDVVSQLLWINDQPFKLMLEGRLGCFRIATSGHGTIPPRTEVVVSGKVWGDPIQKGRLPAVGMIEPVDDYLLADRGLVARSLVTVNDSFPI